MGRNVPLPFLRQADRGRDYAKGYVTIGDIMKQLADAYAVPWENTDSMRP